MSVLLITKAWKINVENAARKLVLIKLADNANDQGICWPSYKNLAINCEMSRRTVMRHVEDLILTGFIKKQSRKGGVHINKSNLFQLTIDEGDISTLKEAKKSQKLAKKMVKEKDVKTVASDNLTLGLVVTEDHPSGDTGSPDLVILTTLPSDTGSPRTIIEPSIEPSVEPSCPKRSKKTSFIREIFNLYPAHRRGGTDGQLWKLWKAEKLTPEDAKKIIAWLFQASQSDPQWGTQAGGQFVYGLTKFIQERIWLTPIPVVKPNKSNPSTNNAPDFHSGDTEWAQNLGM